MFFGAVQIMFSCDDQEGQQCLIRILHQLVHEGAVVLSLSHNPLFDRFFVLEMTFSVGLFFSEGNLVVIQSSLVVFANAFLTPSFVHGVFLQLTLFPTPLIDDII